MPINNFMLATEPLSSAQQEQINPDDLCMYDAKFVVNYWKLSADGRMLFGGGENYTRRFPADIKAFVRKYMLRLYPQLQDARIDWLGRYLAVTIRMPCFAACTQCFYALVFRPGAIATLAGKLIRGSGWHGRTIRCRRRFHRRHFREAPGCAGPGWSPVCPITHSRIACDRPPMR
jgi:gamma-glutamylputrescine oxidase